MMNKIRQTKIGIIPEDWEVKKINQVTDQIFSGGTPNTRISEYWDGNIPWLSSGETSNTFIFKTERRITELGVKNSSTRLAKAGDIVVASAGQGYTRGQASFCMIDTYVNQSVVVLRANERILESRFLFYNLLSRYNELRRISDAHSSRGSLTTKLLADLNIQIPPIREQTAIAKMLTDLDLKITLNRQMNSTLEAIGQALFKRWFVDFEFPDEEGRPYRSSGGEIVETELGEVPKGWCVGVFKDCCKRIENGGTPKRNEPKYWEPATIPWLTSGEVRQSIVILTENFISNEGLANSSAKLWPSTTTVVALYGATAGQVCFLAKEMCGNQACCGLIPTENMRFYIYLRASLSIEAFERQTRGSAQQNLSQQIVADFPIIIPDSRVLEQFDKAVEPIFGKWISNLYESYTLTSIRDALLPKLMSGEIRINK